jgi:beta-glucosidase
MFGCTRRRSLRRPLAVGALLLAAAARPASADSVAGEASIDALIARMTVEEKAGQLNLLSSDLTSTGPAAPADLEAAIKKGEVGGVFNVYGAAYAARLQHLALEHSRLGIPLLLGFDVLHGYKTIFPIPLGQAASWDPEAIAKADRIAATEAAAAGVNWTYAPMVDVARDPRWGRVAEGAGESPWLGARIAEAEVRGLQGDGLDRPDSIAACAKHFAAYGAAESGRDYNTVDISERTLREVYLPPFQAAIDAGVPCLMTALNDVDGLPAVANPHLLRDILRGELRFDGLVTSDYGGVPELVVHGVAASTADAARAALSAGTDVDMQGGSYAKELPKLVRSGAVPMAVLDAAVRRVLRLKIRLGLFENPLRGLDPERERHMLLTPEHRAAAADLARESIVLLKNDGHTLPLNRNIRRLAVIGPLADDAYDMLGSWSGAGDKRDVVTLLAGLRGKLGASLQVVAASGGTVERSTASDIADAINVATGADAIVLAVGERQGMSGEAASRTTLDLPGDQMALVHAIAQLGKPTVAILFNGRPLAVPDLVHEMPAILEAWFPGTLGGPALADILVGDAEPVGRLPMTFPRSVGQIPIYHEQKATGRPPSADHYTSRYLDESTTPLFPFGWGLSYTAFSFGRPKLDHPSLRAGATVTVAVDVTNTSGRAGTAMVQLYIRDLVASVTRPLRQLRGFQRVTLAPGETRTVRLHLSADDLAFWRADMTYGTEPGRFLVMTGPNAADTRSVPLDLSP